MVYVKYEAGERSELVLAVWRGEYISAIIDYNHHVDWAEVHFLLKGLHTYTHSQLHTIYMRLTQILQFLNRCFDLIVLNIRKSKLRSNSNQMSFNVYSLFLKNCI
jgi:hypothetical protein